MLFIKDTEVERRGVSTIFGTPPASVKCESVGNTPTVMCRERLPVFGIYRLIFDADLLSAVHVVRTSVRIVSSRKPSRLTAF